MHNLWISILCTLATLIVFAGMTFSYTGKRTKRRYSLNRETAPSIREYTTLSKVLFVSNMLLTMLTHWVSFPLFLTFWKSSTLTVIGTGITVTGFLLLLRSFKTLGDHYSPMFDAFYPSAIVTHGVYRIVRHPIYLFNLMVSLGLTLASGSLIVLVNSIIGGTFVIRAIYLEEDYLKTRFSEYGDYCKSSWRLVPFVY